MTPVNELRRTPLLAPDKTRSKVTATGFEPTTT